MTTTKAPGDGLPAQLPDEDFHDYMSRLYRDQGLARGESPYLASRFPQQLYAQFWQFLHQKGWGHSTGLQFAVIELLKNQKEQQC